MPPITDDLEKANPVAKVTKMVTGASPDSCPRLSENRRRRVIEELYHGQELASKLQIHLLQSQSTADRDRRLLVTKILNTFIDALSVLGSTDSSGADELPQESLCSDLDSGDSRRIPVSKDRRGSKKRKRVSKTRMVVSPTIEDGCAWRKYGQKVIMNFNHPRSYFRCTHKYDQGCIATKQVQRMEGALVIYQIAYIGDHTCTFSSPITTNLDAAIAFANADTDDPLSSNSCNISFSDSNSNLHDDPPRFYWPTTSAEGENWVSKEDTTSGLTDNLSSFDDTDFWTDLNDFEILPLEKVCDNQDFVAMSNNHCQFSTQDTDPHIFD